MRFLLKFFSLNRQLSTQQSLGDIPTDSQIYKTVLIISLPAIADMVLISITSVIDTVMVSEIGDFATAAVGLTAQPRLIILAAFMAISTGVTAFVSRRKGEGDSVAASSVLVQTLIMSFFGSVIFSLLGAVFAKEIMLFMGAKPDYIDYAATYFSIIMVGIPFNVMTIFINSAQRGCGNTRISMVVNTVSNIVNIFFNYLLIGGNLGFPKLGVAGAAWATTFGNISAFFVAIYVLVKRDKFLKFRWKYLFMMNKAQLVPVFRLGLAAGVEQVFFRVGFLLTNIIVASLGTQAVAANTACSSIQQLVFAFCDGVSMSAAALFGQELGKKRPDMSSIYYHASRKLALAIVFILSTLLIVFSSAIMLLFTEDSHIIFTGGILLVIVAVAAPLQTLQYITASCLRTAGDAKYTARVTMGSVGILRPLLAYALCYPLGLGIIGPWLSYFIDQVVRYTLCQKRFSSQRWKNISL